MPELLASGTTELASSNFALTSGQSTTLTLFDAAGPVVPDDALVHIQELASNGQYMNLGDLTSSELSKVLTATGTFRVLRRRCSGAIGVDRD